MIKEFAGRKFRTRDGKCDADIVARLKGRNPYVYLAVLDRKDRSLYDHAEIYTKDLFFYDSRETSRFDLIEVKRYDWPLWTPIYAWDCREKPIDHFPLLFAGVSEDGRPMSFRYHYEAPPRWEKLTWEHAELIDTEKEDAE